MYRVTDNSYQCVAYPDLGPSYAYVELLINIFTEIKKGTQEGGIGKIKKAGGQVSHSDLQTEICLMYLQSSPECSYISLTKIVLAS